MLKEKIKKLKKQFSKQESYTLLFSGGVDSCAILGAAIDAGIDIAPVWIDNGFNRTGEDEIRQQAENVGAKNLKILKINPGQGVVCNPIHRCYVCKTQIITSVNSQQSGSTLLDGTTASDLNKYRPGSKALKEFDVKSLLATAQISKEEAVKIALHYGADKKIADMESCLATRINYNFDISPERIAVIKEIEKMIIDATGDYNVRCRVDSEEFIRIEVAKQISFEKIIEADFKIKIVNAAQKITDFVTLDLLPSRPNQHDKKIKTKKTKK